MWLGKMRQAVMWRGWASYVFMCPPFPWNDLAGLLIMAYP
jgi:hypothetical protein